MRPSHTKAICLVLLVFLLPSFVDAGIFCRRDRHRYYGSAGTVQRTNSVPSGQSRGDQGTERVSGGNGTGRREEGNESAAREDGTDTPKHQRNWETINKKLDLLLKELRGQKSPKLSVQQRLGNLEGRVKKLEENMVTKDRLDEALKKNNETLLKNIEELLEESENQ